MGALKQRMIARSTPTGIAVAQRLLKRVQIDDWLHRKTVQSERLLAPALRPASLMAGSGAWSVISGSLSPQDATHVTSTLQP